MKALYGISSYRAWTQKQDHSSPFCYEKIAQGCGREAEPQYIKI